MLVDDLPQGTDQITIRADQWRILTFVDARRSVQDVARDSGSSLYRTAMALAELAEAGMIARAEAVVVTPAEADAVTTPAESTRWVAEAAAQGAEKASQLLRNLYPDSQIQGRPLATSPASNNSKEKTGRSWGPFKH